MRALLHGLGRALASGRRSTWIGWALPVAASIGLVAGAAAADGATLVVRSESRIQLHVERDVERLQLRGVLRDDRGGLLAGRALDVRVEGAGGVRTHTVETDPAGSFSLRLDGGRAERVEVGFAGDAYHAGTRVERALHAELEDVRLGVVVSGVGRIDLDGDPVRVTVTADSDAGADDLAVALEDELGRPLARGRTDASGRVTFELPAARLGAPGPGRVVAHGLEDARRARTTTEFPVVRFHRTSLSLEADPARVRGRRPVRLRGRLLAGRLEPVAGAAIGLFADDKHLDTVLTDAAGRYEVTTALPGGDAGARSVVARFESPRAALASSASPPVRVHWSAGWGRWLGASAAVLLATVLAVLALQGWAARRRAARAPGRRASAAPGIAYAPRGRAADRFDDVSGRVVAAGPDALPIADASVTFRPDGDTGASAAAHRTDAEGRFEAAGLAPGRWTLRVEARAHVPFEVAIELPHRGEWRGVEVRLESLRAAALAHFERAVVPRLARADRWFVQTNRELVRNVGGEAELRALEARLEALYYGADPPDAEQVADVGRAAARVEGREPSGRPPR